MNCPKCGEPDNGWDGFCIDCWPGYNSCAEPKCRHYRCEHNICLGAAVYVKPGHEPIFQEGDHYEGCWNADCPCEKFQESKA